MARNMSPAIQVFIKIKNKIGTAFGSLRIHNKEPSKQNKADKFERIGLVRLGLGEKVS
jgi:hypothetical protein